MKRYPLMFHIKKMFPYLQVDKARGIDRLEEPHSRVCSLLYSVSSVVKVLSATL